MFGRNKSYVLRGCCHGGGCCSIPLGCLAVQAETLSSLSGASRRAWEKDVWDVMRNTIKLLHVFRYPLSSWEGFRRGGKHIRPGLLLGHTLSRVQRKPVAGGEHYHKVVKHLETTEEPDNLQNKTPVLESQATIFKAHCFRRTHTKYVI